MPEIIRPGGLTISLPETYTISTPETSETGSTGQPIEEFLLRRRRNAGLRSERARMPEGAEPQLEERALLEALKKQDMQLVDSIALEPKRDSTPVTGIRHRSEEIPEQQDVVFKQDMLPGEDGVLLVEQDGIYSWIFAEKEERMSSPAAQRSAPEALATRRTSFRLDVHATRRKTSATAERRGFFGDIIYSKVKVFVLKFVARITVGLTMRFLERKVKRGLVLIESTNSDHWRRVKNMRSVSLPTDRPAKILLLVHGTFSSTIGSFAALTSTPWGQAFMNNALEKYDVVLGFDHLTLSVNPMDNAVDLLERLAKGRWTHPPKVDAIAFSRGGLVLRCLMQHLGANADWPGRFERAVFVGCTNGGTALAEPSNWHTLVDLYTNLAAGSSRLLSLVPQIGTPVMLLSEIIQGLGSLIKFIAAEAVTEGGVPGLAAMEPDGLFITGMNRDPAPVQEKTALYAVTSQFEPDVSGNAHTPGELPYGFVLRLAEDFVDRLMQGAPNDVVVDTASMTVFDPYSRQFLKDQYNFGVTSTTYHLNYFIQPEVTAALNRWLQLGSGFLSRLREGAGGDQVTDMPEEVL